MCIYMSEYGCLNCLNSIICEAPDELYDIQSSNAVIKTEP